MKVTTKTTKSARTFMKRHIKRHMKKGMEQKRAVAAAYSEARKKGYTVPKRKRKKD
jgi:hypothetical protein